MGLDAMIVQWLQLHFGAIGATVAVAVAVMALSSIDGIWDWLQGR